MCLCSGVCHTPVVVVVVAGGMEMEVALLYLAGFWPPSLGALFCNIQTSVG